MREAQIRCLCAEYHLADLGLVLTMGQMVYLPETKARGSAELQHAAKVRAVEVRWGSRCEVSKSPSPPWLKRKPRVFPTPEPVVSREEVERQARDAARREVGDSLRDIIREELQRALQSAPSPGPSAAVDSGAILEAVRSALAQSGGPVVHGTPVPKSGDEPMFIPTGIVPTETKGTIEVPSETSSGDEVADTAAALKAARGRPRKKEK